MTMARRKSSRTRNSAFNVVTGVGGQMLRILLNFVVRTVFIHVLGKEYLGVTGLFTNILTMLSLTELGFGTAINFKLYKPLAEGDEHRVRVLLKFYKQAYRVVGTVTLLLGLCTIPLLPHVIRDYGSVTRLGIPLALIFMLHVMRAVTSYWFLAYRSAVVKADQKTYLLDVVDFGIAIATSTAEILVLVLWRSFVAFTATLVVFNIVQNGVNAFIAQRRYPRYFLPEKDRLSRSEIRGMLKDCLALLVYKLNHVVVKATDNIVISRYISLAAVGLYSNYFLCYTSVSTLLGRVYTAVTASMGNLFATADLPKKYRFFQVVNFISVFIFGSLGAGIAVCADEFVLLWIGPDYVIPQPFAVLMGTEVLFYGLRMNLAQIRNVSGAFRQMWFRPALGVLVNLGVSVWLVRCWGIPGVLVGTIVADITTYFAVDPGVIHRFSFKGYRPVSEYYAKNLLYIAQLAAVVAADLWLCRRWCAGHGFLSLLAHGMLVLLTVPTSFLLVYWKSHECAYLRQMGLGFLRKGRKGGKPAGPDLRAGRAGGEHSPLAAKPVGPDLRAGRALGEPVPGRPEVGPYHAGTGTPGEPGEPRGGESPQQDRRSP